MNRTLRFGSRGDDVVKLQDGLNRLPSNLPRLVTDGHYGSKTTGRVQEFQRGHGLVPDGITGPLTWDMFMQLLAKLQQGTLPPVTIPSPGAVDPRRPVVLLVAQKHFGVVDFQQMVAGRPKGIDFLIEMFRVAAKINLTDANSATRSRRSGATSPG